MLYFHTQHTLTVNDIQRLIGIGQAASCCQHFPDPCGAAAMDACHKKMGGFIGHSCQNNYSILRAHPPREWGSRGWNSLHSMLPHSD